MHLFSNSNILKRNLLNILLAVIPFSFIAGNMLVNINIFLFLILAFMFFGKEIFKLNFYVLDKIIFCFFVFIIFTGFYNYFFFDLKVKSFLVSPIKSILFFRYFILYLVLRILIEKNIIDLKFFFIFSSLAVMFVSLDIILQFFNGEDIFGFVPQGRKYAGPFGDELIAGGFIQRFSLFILFLIPIFIRNNLPLKLERYLIASIFIILSFSIIVSGNRMPAVIFLFTISLIILFQKQTRKYFLPFFLIFSLMFLILFKTNENIKNNFSNFYGQVFYASELIIKKDFLNNQSPQYLKEFATFYDTWLMNKYIGGGIKNFRFYCHHRPNLNKNTKFVCNMHPHNYYLEILTETGVLGFLIILSVFLSILYLTFVKKYLIKSTLNDNKIIIPFIFLFIAEIFPIKSTGSFFTTGNATYVFLIIGIMIGIIRKYNSIENSK